MSGEKSELTYRDVKTILALLDGWGRGRVHFRDGDFEVDACVVEPTGVAPLVRRLDVPSPGVGVFRTAGQEIRAGEPVREGIVIGHIVTPDDSTPVTAGVAGRLLEFLSEDGDFVEYGQSVAVIAP